MTTEKQIVLYTASTPNGVCASIYSEELKSAYPDFDYEYVSCIQGDRQYLTNLPQSPQN